MGLKIRRMKILRKKICTLIGLLLIVSLSLMPVFAAPKKITLSVVYYYTSEAARNVMDKIFSEYEAANPNINLEIQVTTQAKWPEVMKTRAVAGQLPDVSLTVPQRVGEWAEAGLLQDGTKYIPKSVLEKYDPVRCLSDRYDGKICGLPANTTVRAVAYNVDYFKKAGIQVPTKASEAWTWEEMVAAAKKAQAASGAKYALQFEKPSFDGWLPFLYQAGGALFNKDMTKVAINSSETRRALEWTVKLHEEGIAAPGIFEGTEDPLRTFASGLSTMWLGTGNWMMAALDPQMQHEYSFTFLPKDIQQATVVGGGDWIVFKGKYPKEAWDFVLFVLNQENMARYNSVHISIPPRSDVHAEYSVKPELAPFFMEQSRMVPEELMAHQLLPAYAAGRDKLLQELGACVSGQQSVDETIKAWEQILNENLKK